MKRLALFMVITVSVAGTAQCDYKVFDFEGIRLTDDDDAIGSYMSSVYGSTVVVDDCEVTDNDALADHTWVGNNSQFVRHTDDPRHYSSDLGVLFADKPIRALSAATRAYAFWDSGGVDLWVKAVGTGWDRDGGTLESPSYSAADYLVEKAIWARVGPDGSELDVMELVFDEPVYVVTFRGHYRHQIAIDHLAVEPWDSPTAEQTLAISSTIGGSVTVPGEGIFAYTAGATVPVTATADAGYQFAGWTGTAVDAGAVANPAAATTTVTVDSDYTLVANFTVERSLIISSTIGGSVTVPGEGVFVYADGATVALTATADVGYQFAGWEGTAVDVGAVADPYAASTVVTVDADYTLEANFTPLPVEYILTIASTSWGTVTTPGEGDFLYAEGTVVPVVATADVGYQFEIWTGSAVDAGAVADPAAASTTVTADADYTLIANFKSSPVVEHILTIASTSGGSVTAPGEGAFVYAHGAVVPVTATAAAGCRFDGWTGMAVDAGRVANPFAASTTVTIDSDYTLVATFYAPGGDYVFFDFEGIGLTDDDDAIGAHMSSVYGSTVVVDDFEVTRNNALAGCAWVGNSSQFVRHTDDPKHYSSDLCVLFADRPIRALSVDTRAYAFWDSGGVDLWVKAVGTGWDRDGGTLESPMYSEADYLVEKAIRAEIGPDGGELNIREMIFDEPVYVLTFRGHRPHQIAIDHLGVEPW